MCREVWSAWTCELLRFLGSARLTLMPRGCSGLGGVKVLQWFQPGRVGPTAWTTQMHYRAHLWSPALRGILHRSTFSLCSRANFLPAAFYSEKNMRGPLSKHPLDNITTLGITLGSLLLRSNHQVIQAKPSSSAAESPSAWFPAPVAAPWRRADCSR